MSNCLRDLSSNSNTKVKQPKYRLKSYLVVFAEEQVTLCVFCIHYHDSYTLNYTTALLFCSAIIKMISCLQAHFSYHI